MAQAAYPTAAALSQALGLEQTPPAWDAAWPEAMPAADAWPGAQRLAAGCDFLSLPADLAVALERCRAACAAQAALAQLVAISRWLLWKHPDQVRSIGPVLPPRWGEAGRLVHALVLVGGVEETRRLHAQRQVEAAVTRDTLADYRLWMQAYRDRHGDWGLDQADWLTRHAQGGLYQLGRLQFEPADYHQPFIAYRHRDGRSVLLAADGEAFTHAGLFADSGHSGGHHWTARAGNRDGVVSGHPVTADGRVSAEPIQLVGADWRRAFGPGDRALAVHIPATGPMDHAACCASFAAATAFFRDRLPAPGPSAFTTDSWLLDPQLRSLLKADSNIVRFQSHWQLHPLRQASPQQALERVFGFGTTVLDPATAPQTSSLQRAVVAHFQAGGTLRNGGGVVVLPRSP